MMMKIKEKIKKYWYWYILFLLFSIQAISFLIWREDCFLAVHDNLDLFLAQYQMIKNEGAFFAQNSTMPMLGGVSRDLLGSEFLLNNILYILLPSFYAYLCAYFLKIAIGFLSMRILLREYLKESFDKYQPIVALVSFAFGLIPVFPTYGIAFTSIPLVVFLGIKLYKEPKWYYFLGLFTYPFFSYFSYFGFFILAYMGLFFLGVWIKEKKCNMFLLGGIITLSIGYVAFEYRLFREMLFSDTVTIRETIVFGNHTFVQALMAIKEALVENFFHSQDSHSYVVLPIVILALVFLNVTWIKEKKTKKIIKHPINIIALFILINAVVYGLYTLEVVRTIFETLLPPLKGFQFNRTIFLNPFLWYLLLFLILKEAYDSKKQIWRMVGNAIALIAVFVVMFAPQVYNDFYTNLYCQSYQLIKGKQASTLNYREFYAEELFELIKKDISYNGEWAIAYGLHPGILNYNGIATLDGYLGLYELSYKEEFRKIIAPALEKSEEFATYFDDWGARAYIYSGNGENTYEPLRNFSLEDTTLYIDINAFHALNGTYIFSRIELENAKELGIELIKMYEKENYAYTIYVYK
ncbi:MAG: DUF6044 family protein [Lachnospiraceae bacterium]